MMHKSIDIEQVIDVTIASAEADGHEVSREEVREVWDGFLVESRDKFGWAPFDFEKPENVEYQEYLGLITKTLSVAEGLNEIGVKARPMFFDSPDWLDVRHCTPLHAVLGRMAPSLLMAVRDVLIESLRLKLSNWDEPAGVGGSLDEFIEGSDTVLTRLITSALASGIDVSIPPTMEPVAEAVGAMRDAGESHARKEKAGTYDGEANDMMRRFVGDTDPSEMN